MWENTCTVPGAQEALKTRPGLPGFLTALVERLSHGGESTTMTKQGELFEANGTNNGHSGVVALSRLKDDLQYKTS